MGAKIINQISAALRAALPDMKGFSAPNLKYRSINSKLLAHNDLK